MKASAPLLPYGARSLPLPRSGFEIESLPPPPARGGATGSPLQAFESPIGGVDLAVALRGAKRVLVAVSDATRSTGSARFLPALLDRIEGVSRASVTFVVGSGIHRPPTDEEIVRILGRDLARRHRVARHDPVDETGLQDLGRTSAGTPVRVHATVTEHDRLVLTGTVTFHYYAGFGGGRKAVVPGLAARETVIRNHLRALRSDGTRHPAARAGRLHGNPVHRDMAEGAALTRPALLVNSVIGADGEIERLFVGHWRRAHEAACRYLRRTRTVRVRPRDLLIVSAGGAPYDVDLIQAHKAFEASAACVADGGVVVLVARCPDGHGHEDLRVGLEDLDEDAIVAELRAGYRVYLQTALAWKAKLRRVRLVLVSGLPDDAVRRTGAEPAKDLDQALRLAARSVPPGSAGWVLPHGVRFLVRAGNRAEGEGR